MSHTPLYSLVDQLAEQQTLSFEDYCLLIHEKTSEIQDYTAKKAEKIRKKHYQIDIYIRGLIEFSNYCKNDCYYCGIRKSNHQAQRYHLTPEQILSACNVGYDLGFRTFVLQGGEDGSYSAEAIASLVNEIKQTYPDCALTLSLGERSYEDYALWKQAGCDRYLLRHETADEEHYRHLHPQELSLQNRMQCLWNLKALGYQVGTGFMVGSPGQTPNCLAKDLKFIEKLQPQMVGIGPFISHKDTPFCNEPSGNVDDTLFMLSLLRLILPKALLPATTALGTIDPLGREKAIQAGGNVVMPNLSPRDVRSKYLLYDNKICTGDEAAECIFCMRSRMTSIGYDIAITKGDPVA